jgi:hypothetical protein
MKTTSGGNCLVIILCSLFVLAIPTMLGYGPNMGGTQPNTGTTGGTYGNVLVCKGTLKIRIPNYLLPRKIAQGWKLCS